jgi:hypothetical protein
MMMSGEKKQMTLGPLDFGLAFGANLVVAIGFVVVTYTLMERRLVLGAIGGLALGALIVWAQATVGEMLWTLTFEQRRNLIVVAGVGAGLGIVGTLMTLKPEIE